MPNFAAIALADAETTPVTHTFNPSSQDGPLAKWANRAATTLKGSELLNVEVREPNGSGGAHRVIASMYDPTETSVEGVTVVDHANSFKFEINFAQTSSLQERKNLLKLAENLMKDSSFVDCVTNMTPYY